MATTEEELRSHIRSLVVERDSWETRCKDLEQETEDVKQPADVFLVKEFILWARENGVILGEVHISNVKISLSDPRVSLPAIPEPGEHDDTVDRTDYSEASSYYQQHALARSRTPGKPKK